MRRRQPSSLQQTICGMKYRRKLLYTTLLVISFVILIRTYPWNVFGMTLLERQTHYTILNINSNTNAPEIFSQIKTILLWTPFFSTKDYMASMTAQGCAEARCNVTSDKSLLSQSDAIVFHHRDMNPNDLPSLRHSWQRWVYLNHESPPNSPRDSLAPLRDKFNWTVTYRIGSDVLLTPLPRLRRSDSSSVAAKDFTQNKTAMAVWFVSNCHTPGNREAYVAQLRKTIPVDIYGDCGKKKCVPKMSPSCYKDAAARYRFYLSFENSICKDYATEKLYHVYDLDMVPVVFGGADYSKLAPVGSYINAMDFKSPKALGKHLLHVAKTPQMYNDFFKWRRKYEIAIEPYACQLCKKLHDPSEPPKVWTDLEQWWFDDAQCKRWPT